MDEAIITVLGIFIGNISIVIPLFIWHRAESRADIRHMDNKIDVILEMIYEMHMDKNKETQ